MSARVVDDERAPAARQRIAIRSTAANASREKCPLCGTAKCRAPGVEHRAGGGLGVHPPPARRERADAGSRIGYRRGGSFPNAGPSIRRSGERRPPRFRPARKPWFSADTRIWSNCFPCWMSFSVNCHRVLRQHVACRPAVHDEQASLEVLRKVDRRAAPVGFRILLGSGEGVDAYRTRCSSPSR